MFFGGDECILEQINVDVEDVFEKFKSTLEEKDLREFCSKHAKYGGTIVDTTSLYDLLKESTCCKNRFVPNTPLKGAQIVTILTPIVSDFENQTKAFVERYVVERYGLFDLGEKTVSNRTALNVQKLLRHVCASFFSEIGYEKRSKTVSYKDVDKRIVLLLEKYNKTVETFENKNDRINLIADMWYINRYSVYTTQDALRGYDKTVSFGKYLCRLLKYAKRFPEHAFTFVFDDPI